jgi:hypothetical protein
MRPFEGKVLSLRGIARVTTRSGSAIAAGLFHLGCRHSTACSSLADPTKRAPNHSLSMLWKTLVPTGAPRGPYVA